MISYFVGYFYASQTLDDLTKYLQYWNLESFMDNKRWLRKFKIEWTDHIVAICEWTILDAILRFDTGSKAVWNRIRRNLRTDKLCWLFWAWWVKRDWRKLEIKTAAKLKHNKLNILVQNWEKIVFLFLKSATL